MKRIHLIIGIVILAIIGLTLHSARASDMSPKDREAAIEKYLAQMAEYRNKGNPKEAFNALKSAAELGSLEAQYNISGIYQSGVDAIGLAADPLLAKQYLENAAGGGYAAAQFSLGIHYFAGENGYEQDIEKSFRLMLLAAEQGHPEAQYRISKHYQGGLGVTRDSSEYVEWLMRSANNGFSIAQFDLGEIILSMANREKTYSKKVELLRQAGEYIRAAANQGHEEAQEAAKELNELLDYINRAE